MKITKRQLKQIIKEEVDKVFSESEDMKKKTVLSVWEEYEKDIASLPDVRHPDGTKREERACARRTKNRMIKDRNKDCWWCGKEDKIITSKPKPGQC